MSNLIDRDEVIEIIESVCSADDTYWQPGVLEKIRDLPTHPTPSNTLGALDCVDRQAAIDEFIAFKDAHKADRFTGDFIHWTGIKAMIENLPSVQPKIIRCKDCKWFNKPGCSIWIVDDSDKPSEDDYCSFAELRGDSDEKD